MTWQVFASYKDILETDFIYIQVEFANDNEYEQFLLNCEAQSSIKYDARILTLSTCDARW